MLPFSWPSLVVLSGALPFAAGFAPRGAPLRDHRDRRAATTSRGDRAAQPAPKVISKKPCPDDSIFTCITLRVPRDHFSSAANGPTFDVTFGLLKATGPRKGVFVTATGGPGTSGLAVADSYTERVRRGHHRELRHRLLRPARGRRVGAAPVPRGGPRVLHDRRRPDRLPRPGPCLRGAAKTFAHDCIDETGVDPSALPFFATRQAVEDLEAFRVYLKADKLDLYGESYGTQYVQTYAAAHPNRVRALTSTGRST